MSQPRIEYFLHAQQPVHMPSLNLQERRLGIRDGTLPIVGNAARSLSVESLPIQLRAVFLLDARLILEEPVEQFFVCIGIPTVDTELGPRSASKRETRTIRDARKARGKRVPVLRLANPCASESMLLP